MNKLSLLSHCIAKFDLFIRKFIFDLKIIFTAEKENEKNYILFFEKFRLIKIQIIMILLKIFLFKIKIISLY